MSDTIDKRFRIAFSFAGEKRDFVAKTARILADKFGEDKILYDKYHEAEFAVYNLGIKLPKLYGEESFLIVPVLCKDYDHKKWTGWEWVHIYGLLTQVDGHRVMPSRFDFANADGLSPTAGFIELDEKTPEDFANLILERIALNECKTKDYYKTEAEKTKEPRTIIPNNLPRIQPFFGREEELKKIADALDPENRGWGVLIDAPGGMGKTSLAIRAALDVSPELFEKIVFVSLKSREMDDDGERYLDGFLIDSLPELYNELAKELGNSDIAKFPEDQRARMLIDSLRDTRTLLILDNLESLLKKDRDVIFNFVKRLPLGCKAILTSRGRIGSGGEELILEKLDENAALATLAELAEHNKELSKTNEEERKKLYIETAGKPLLLRWTAGQVGRGSCLTIDDAIAHLRSCPDGNDPLEFIFGDLVEEFTPEETKILCALTYFTMPAKPEHIVNIAECKKEETDKALRALSNRSLAVPNEERTTYTLVPLVADFLRKKRPEIIKDTGNILEKQVYALVIENGYDNHEKFPVLDSAWPTIAAAIPRFLVGANDRLQQICGALQFFLNYTGRWDERITLAIDSEKKAVYAEDYYNAGWRACELGWTHIYRRQANQVLACAERAATYWQKANSGQREKAIAFRIKGIGYTLLGDYSAAIEALKKALGIFKTVNSGNRDITSSLIDLAKAKNIAGDRDGAEQDYDEALWIAKNSNDFVSIAILTGNLAALALEKKQWSEAEKLASEALLFSKQIGRLELIGDNCSRLVQAFQKQDKKGEVLLYAEQAVQIYTKLGHPGLAAAIKTLKECEGKDEE